MIYVNILNFPILSQYCHPIPKFLLLKVHPPQTIPIQSEANSATLASVSLRPNGLLIIKNPFFSKISNGSLLI